MKSKPSNNRIKEFRKGCDLSQKQLGEKVGLSRESICNIENGKAGLTLENAEKIADILGVEPARIIGYDIPEEDNVLQETITSYEFRIKELQESYDNEKKQFQSRIDLLEKLISQKDDTIKLQRQLFERLEKQYSSLESSSKTAK